MLGAGVFVTTVVAGTISLVTPFRSIQRPLLRDIIFFMIASFAAYVAMYDGKLYLVESLGFIIMYIIYLIVLIGGYFVNRRIKERRAILQAIQTEEASKNYGSIQTPIETGQSADSVSDNIPDESYTQPDVTFTLALRHAFLPRNDAAWSEKGLINKVFTVVKVRDKE